MLSAFHGEGALNFDPPTAHQRIPSWTKGRWLELPTRRPRKVGSHVGALSAAVGLVCTEVGFAPRRHHRCHQGYQAVGFKPVGSFIVAITVFLVWGYIEGCVSLVAFITRTAL